MNENVKKKIKFVVINLIVAVVLVIGIVLVTKFWTKKYTQLGIEYSTPNVVGLTPEEAQIVLDAEHLRLEIIDSTYSRDLPFGTIVEQNPPIDAHVKEGRTIYAIVNAHGKQHVSFPNLVDMSLRQAISLLHSLHLDTLAVIYQPSEYKGLILEVQVDSGMPLPAGESLLEGTKVLLIVGNGPGTEQVKVPDVIGKDFRAACSILLHASLTTGAKVFDVTPTAENMDSFFVFKQEPAPGTMLLEGSHVDIHLSRTENALIFESSSDENDFF